MNTLEQLNLRYCNKIAEIKKHKFVLDAYLNEIGGLVIVLDEQQTCAMVFRPTYYSVTNGFSMSEVGRYICLPTNESTETFLNLLDSIVTPQEWYREVNEIKRLYVHKFS